MTKPATEPTLLLTRQELAYHLRVSERQLDTLRSNGALPEPLILGNSPRWSRKQIELWIDAQLPQTKAAEQSDSGPNLEAEASGDCGR